MTNERGNPVFGTAITLIASKTQLVYRIYLLAHNAAKYFIFIYQKMYVQRKKLKKI